MSGYRVDFAAEAEADLDRLTRAELYFLAQHLRDLAEAPAEGSIPAGSLAHPDGGMLARAVMQAGDDATYFEIVFRYSADETAIVIHQVDVYRPPGDAAEAD